ncbi:hypothetical protein PAAG_06890 [Paracoccidioides lutzii Pb01]|uniref:Uncharacterized protein n=1 Tax=Paracoccidioides lutzii (strain ATCC MYA-826 / Pb01) TaxID=502779 RepID=C1H7Z9_PARBA|nr:hypothetical protein PAAG_06890 [Paracoccidioides lutzii Pb01]EEH36472.2 hypothetical protein PAAG_06890 [Paracoccidioides lutzii Pb01]
MLSPCSQEDQYQCGQEFASPLASIDEEHLMSDDSPKEHSSARHAPNPPKLDVLDLAASVSGMKLSSARSTLQTPNSTLCSNGITGKRCLNASLRHTLATLYTPASFKPTNFVLVRGRLKIIVLSIANLIGDDTVNVRRDHQIVTPNYMVPEALLDNSSRGDNSLGTGEMLIQGRKTQRYLELGLHIISNKHTGELRSAKYQIICIDWRSQVSSWHHPSLASMLEAGAKAASDHRRSSLPVRRIPIAR